MRQRFFNFTFSKGHKIVARTKRAYFCKVRLPRRKPTMWRLRSHRCGIFYRLVNFTRPWASRLGVVAPISKFHVWHSRKVSLPCQTPKIFSFQNFRATSNRCGPLFVVAAIGIACIIHNSTIYPQHLSTFLYRVWHKCSFPAVFRTMRKTPTMNICDKRGIENLKRAKDVDARREDIMGIEFANVLF